LFLGAIEEPKCNLMVLSYNGTHRATRELIEQLIRWEPQSTGKTDLVMALWFADLGCRKQLVQSRNTHMPSRWTSRAGMAQRQVVHLQDWLDASVPA
jgi:phosphopantothenoylcysteine synthetase/decarboxylase